MRRLILWAVCTTVALSTEWDSRNFPNPTAGQFHECKMKAPAKICDPDGVLTDAGRNRLDYELQMLETRTRQDMGPDFCAKKGVTAAMAVAKHIKEGSTEAVKTMANSMLRDWTLDSQCQKAIVIVVSTDDAKFWVARDDKVPVYADEFTQMFKDQMHHFKNKEYVDALRKILQQTWEKAFSKQGSPRTPSGGGGRQQPQPKQPGFGDGGGGQKPGQAPKMPEFKLPQIPSWFWMAIVFVVIPLLCCCCCCYCCCCRGKGGRTAVPQDGPPGEMGGGGGGGGRAPRGGGGRGGGPFGNLLGSLGGAGVGSMIGNFISNRNRGGGGMGGGGMGMGGMGGGGFAGGGGMGGGDYQGGGAYPAEPQPVYDDNNGQGGGGLYPSVAVKDEGGGGSWA